MEEKPIEPKADEISENVEKLLRTTSGKEKDAGTAGN